jgi:hypothetical protein
LFSDPDITKTTSTEKLPQFGGALQLAGGVKAGGDPEAGTLGLGGDREQAPNFGQRA